MFKIWCWCNILKKDENNYSAIAYHRSEKYELDRKEVQQLYIGLPMFDSLMGSRHCVINTRQFYVLIKVKLNSYNP